MCLNMYEFSLLIDCVGIFRRLCCRSGQLTHSSDCLPAVCWSWCLHCWAATRALSAVFQRQHGRQRPTGQYQAKRVQTVLSVLLICVFDVLCCVSYLSVKMWSTLNCFCIWNEICVKKCALPKSKSSKIKKIQTEMQWNFTLSTLLRVKL